MMQLCCRFTPAKLLEKSLFAQSVTRDPIFLPGFLLLCLLHPWKGISSFLPYEWPSQSKNPGDSHFNCTSREIYESSENSRIKNRLSRSSKSRRKKRSVDVLSGIIRDFPSHFSACSCSNTFRASLYSLFVMDDAINAKNKKALLREVKKNLKLKTIFSGLFAKKHRLGTMPGCTWKQQKAIRIRWCKIM